MANDIQLLTELEQLVTSINIDKKRMSLINIDEQTPLNYRYLKENYESIKYVDNKLVSGKKGLILEGGARSRKTYSVIDFIIYGCLHLFNGKTIIIVRDTYNSFHTTLFTDLEISLDEFGLKNPFKNSQQVTQMRIRDNRIHFKGADNENNTKGAPSHILYFNEMLTIPKDIFNNYIMRCSGMWIGDFNPSVTQHWIFDEVIPRADVGHLRTTYKDNPLCPVGMLVEIESYEPFEQGSYEIVNDKIYYQGKPISDKNTPPAHPTNLKPNLFMWKVYGLGLRGAMQGVIFEDVYYIDEFPKDLQPIYGNDFGFTSDPNAFVKYAETETAIYVELLLYECIERPDILDMYYQEIGITKDDIIICDSSDKYTGENKGTVEMVAGLQDLGWNADKVSKTNSVLYWLLSMKKKSINIVKNGLSKYAVQEAENYRFREVNGISVNNPIDKFNHFWDATRYCHIVWNEKTIDLYNVQKKEEEPLKGLSLAFCKPAKSGTEFNVSVFVLISNNKVYVQDIVYTKENESYCVEKNIEFAKKYTPTVFHFQNDNLANNQARKVLLKYPKVKSFNTSRNANDIIFTNATVISNHFIFTENNISLEYKKAVAHLRNFQKEDKNENINFEYALSVIAELCVKNGLININK